MRSKRGEDFTSGRRGRVRLTEWAARRRSFRPLPADPISLIRQTVLPLPKWKAWSHGLEERQELDSTASRCTEPGKGRRPASPCRGSFRARNGWWLRAFDKNGKSLWRKQTWALPSVNITPDGAIIAGMTRRGLANGSATARNPRPVRAGKTREWCWWTPRVTMHLRWPATV